MSGRGTVAPDRVHGILKAYTLAFFSHFLVGTREPLLDAGSSPFREVEFRHYSAEAASLIEK
jgi:hypothetical protein